MPDTNSIGAVSESRILAKLIGKGYMVAIPFSVARYDLILDTGNELKKVQCKTGRLRDGVIRFHVSSRGPTGKTFRNKPYQGEVDLFAVFCPENEQVYLVPIEDCKAEMRLRVEPARNNQKSGIRNAAEFII